LVRDNPVYHDAYYAACGSSDSGIDCSTSLKSSSELTRRFVESEKNLGVPRQPKDRPGGILALHSPNNRLVRYSRSCAQRELPKQLFPRV
jgi:hypothetical protein